MEDNQVIGLRPATTELIQQADEDLEAFRAKVKKKKRRRAVPQDSTPIELTQLLLLPNYRSKRRSDVLANKKEKTQYMTEQKQRLTKKTKEYNSHPSAKMTRQCNTQ